MSDEILFLHSPLKEKIYGGTKIQKTFGFDEAANQKIGEYWAISAHENGTSIISNGTYKNHSLKVKQSSAYILMWMMEQS